MNLSEKSASWSITNHEAVRHSYDGHPYKFHLEMVVSCAKKFIHLIPESLQDIVLAGCWAHDTIEDCRQTYSDVVKVLGRDVAELVYACTNEKGRSRKDRANDRYYRGIKKVQGAAFIKICDRIANTLHSKNTGSSMFNRYSIEYPDFQSQLFREDYAEMFIYLEDIIYRSQK